MEKQDNVTERLSLIGKTFTELLSLFLCEVKDDDDFYDVLASNIAVNYPGRLTLLMKDFSGVRLRAALFGLAFEDGAEMHIAPYLAHSDGLVVAAALDGLRRQSNPKFGPEIEELRLHSSPYVRGAFLRYVRAVCDFPIALPYLINGLDDANSIVRENALDELTGIAPEGLRDKICQLLMDPVPEVRQAAQSLLDFER